MPPRRREPLVERAIIHVRPRNGREWDVLLPDKHGGGSREMRGWLSLPEALEYAGRQAVRFAPSVVVILAIDGREIGREEVG